MKTLLRILPAFALIAPLATQSDSALVIKTASQKVAENLGSGRMFNEVDVPDLDEGSHYVLWLDEEGFLSITTAEGDATLIDVSARPVEIMDMFADEIDRTRGRGQAFAAMALGQGGVSAKNSKKIVQGIFDFPFQIDHASVIIKGDPDKPKDGYQTAVVMTPSPGTWLESFVNSMQPSEVGAPVLDQADAMVTGALAMEISDYGPWAPFIELVAATGTKSDDVLATRMKLTERMTKCISPIAAVAWDMGGGMQTIYGTSDAKMLTEIYADPGYAEWANTSTGRTDTEFTPNALEHRGITAAKTTLYLDGPGADIISKDGMIETFHAVAGKYGIVAGFGNGESTLKGIIDAALSDSIQTKALTTGVLGYLRVKLSEVAGAMSGGMAPVDEIPQLIDVQLAKAENNLLLSISVK